MVGPFASASSGFGNLQSSAFSPFSDETSEKPVLDRAGKTVELAKYGLPSVLAGMADTFGTSLGLLDDDDVQNTLRDNIPQFGDYYTRNREAAQTVGDLAGMFIPGMAGVKLLQRGSSMYRASALATKGGARTRLMDSLFTSAKTRDQLMSTVRAYDRNLATNFQKDFLKDGTRRTLARRAQLTRVADIAKENVAFELGVFATMNDSQTLYPDEFTTGELIALNASVPAIFAVAETAVMRKLLRTSIQDVAGQANRNFTETGLNEVLYRPGHRDAGLVVESLALKDIQSIVDNLPAENALARENLKSEINVVKASIRKQVENTARDKPLRFGTSQHSVSDAEARTVTSAQEQDPLTLAGTISIEQRPATYAKGQELFAAKQEWLGQYDAQLEKLLKKKKKTRADNDQIDRLYNQKKELEGAEFYVLENDGTLTHAMERRPRVTDNGAFPVKKRVETAASKSGYEFTIPIDADFNFRARQAFIDEDGILSVGGGIDKDRIAGVKASKIAGGERDSANFEMLSLWQRSAVYEGFSRWVDDYKLGSRTLVISADDHYTRLDSLIELHKRHGDAVFGDLQLPTGWKGVDDIAFASLAGKYKEYQKLQSLVDSQAGSPLKVALGRYTQADMRVLLNLKGTNDGSIYPILDVFRQMRVQGDTELPIAFRNMEHLRRAVQESDHFPRMMPFVNNSDDFRGDLIRAKAPKEKPRQPVMLVKRPFDPEAQGREKLVEQLNDLRANVMTDFAQADKYGADIVGELWRAFGDFDNPIMQAARGVDELGEGGQRHRGAVGTQEHAAGENPSILAQRQLEGETDRRVREYLGRVFGEHEENWQFLRAPRNKAHLDSLNVWMNARRAAWDLQDAPIAAKTMDGKEVVQFRLRDTKENRQRWQDRFGEEMPKDANMPAPGESYVPASVTQEAFRGIQSLNKLGQKYLDNVNHIRRMQGLGPINRKEWWVPPKNFYKEEVVHLVDAADNHVATIAGRTLAAARTEANKVIQATDQPLAIVEPKNLERYISLQDDVAEKMVDFRDIMRQTGRATGKGSTLVVETGEQVLNEAIESINRGYESVIRRGRTVMFEPEINYVKKLYDAALPESGQRGQSIYQQYLAAVFGNPTLNPNDLIGRTYFAIETNYDNMLNALWDKAHKAGDVPLVKGENGEILNPSSGQWRGVKVPDAQSQDFTKLQKELGEFTPFNSTVDYMQRTLKITPPPNMKKHFAKLNNITTLLTLRMFEVGHSILTVSSLAATTPAVTKALRPTELERASAKGMERWQARVMAYGYNVDPETVMYNPIRSAMTTMHEMSKIGLKKGDVEVWDRAARQGFLSQNVAETMKALTSPTKNYHENLIEKYTTIVSTLTDKTERFSRGFSFMHFYYIGKNQLKIKDENLLFAFAHRQANENIGNYAPNNRPRMFQGAVGMPLGLFQTFAWNYYQRLFNYVENRQTKALGWQYFSQAAVFGGSTVPGYNEFTELFASNYDGTANPAEALERRFGTETAEWLLYGTLSNLPKLLGSDNGIALYTRGDVNVRRPPTILTASDAPGYQVVKNGITAVAKTIEMFRQQGLSSQRIVEIASQYSTNRTLKNLAQIYQGYAVDRRGALIEDDTREGMALAARLVGMRSLKEARKIEAHARIRNTQFSQRQKMLELRDNLRSNIRAGKLDEKTMNKAVANYVRYGGRPENFANFMAEQFMASKVDKSARELLTIANDPTRAFDIQRLLSGMTTSGNDPEFSE